MPAKKIDQIIIKDGEGKMMNKVWYYIMNDDELESVKEELKTHLEI